MLENNISLIITDINFHLLLTTLWIILQSCQQIYSVVGIGLRTDINEVTADPAA